MPNLQAKILVSGVHNLECMWWQSTTDESLSCLSVSCFSYINVWCS